MSVLKRYRILATGSALLVSIALSSCISDEWVSIGSNIIQSDSRIIYVEDLKVEVSSFKFDSLRTSGTNVALIGRFNDNTIGFVESGSFMAMGNNLQRILGENAVYDSISLSFYQSGYHYGDSLYNATIDVHRVTEEIKTSNHASGFFNTSTFAYDNSALGSISYFVIPSSKNKITVKLNDAFGAEIFSYLRLPVRPEIEEEGVCRYFKGLYIKPGSVSNSILGYVVNDTSFRINVYYHLGNNAENSLVHNISLSSSDRQFNKIHNDSSNPFIKKLTQKPISSDSTNNCGFIQGGSGIFTRIDFPNLREYYQQNSKLEIIKAELQICPSKEMNFKYLPSKLFVYYTNKNNELLSQLTSTNGSAPQDGSLVKDEMFYGRTHYTWDITKFIKSIALTSTIENDGLLLIPQKYNDTFEQLIIASQKYQDSETKLKLYLLSHE